MSYGLCVASFARMVERAGAEAPARLPTKHGAEQQYRRGLAKADVLGCSGRHTKHDFYEEKKATRGSDALLPRGAPARRRKSRPHEPSLPAQHWINLNTVLTPCSMR
jgi:hypothetical protein